MITISFKNLKISGIAAAVSNKWTSIESIKTKENAATIERFIKNCYKLRI